jgi:chromosomal replication initiator protein
MDGAASQHEVFALSLVASAASTVSLSASITAAKNPRRTTPPASIDFFVGPENRLVASIVADFLNQPGHTYSPIILCGLSGAGKSALAEHIAQLPENTLLIRAADFAFELATAIERRTVSQFRAKYLAAEMIVIDDLAQLAGHRAALQELQHLLDALESREVPVLITSRRPPSELSDLPPALRNRLYGGLVVPVSLPGTAAREKILARYAASRGITLSAPALKLLADKFPVAAAELRGIVNQFDVQSTADKAARCKAIEPDDIRAFLARREQATPRPSLNQISTLVAAYYGVKPAALLSASRRRQAVTARALAIYLGRTLCNCSLKALGKHFGGRDHSTVLHNFRQVQLQLAHDPQFAAAVDQLRQSLVPAESHAH